jgi:predicted AAA+ superfamily ATPase
VVLTGARQTGKTTLAQSLFRDLRYVNLDATEDPEALRAIHTAAWDQAVGPAVLDEAQKEPSVFEKVKWAFDAGRIDLTVLLGSSRFLLLDDV